MNGVRIVIGLILSALIAGCGGGGSSATDTASSSPVIPTVLGAEGVYLGTFSDGRAHETVILETGQIYMIYGSRTNTILQETGLIEGLGSVNAGIFSSIDARDFANSVVIANFPAFQDIVSDQVFPVSISANYTTNGSFNGSISESGTTVAGNALVQPSTTTFTGTRPDKSLYDYEEPADLSHVVGSWGQITVLAVTSEGRISLSSRDCAAEGTIKPRAAGKNLFDIEWSFVAIPACPFYGQTIKSIGFARSLEAGSLQVRGQFIIFNTDSARTKKRNYIFYR